jgi:hypothetical protein
VSEQDPPPESVTFIDESGVERRFLLHDAFDVEDAIYYLVEAEDDPDLVLILRETERGLVSVDGDEFERVMAILENS